MSATKSILSEMLQENTGTHFLDSGGHYGRHWQRNQGQNFEAQPAASLRFSAWNNHQGERRVSIELTLNVFHWLEDRLVYNSDLDKTFHAWCEEREDVYPDLQGMQGFIDAYAEGLETRTRECILDSARGRYIGQGFAEKVDRESLDDDAQGDPEDWATLEKGPDEEFYDEAFSNLLDTCRATMDDGSSISWETGECGDVFEVTTEQAEPIEVGGIYGEGRPFTVNTYNGEDLLSQTLQYLYWEDTDGAHVLLQVHNGCDVRGGYTDARVFDLSDNYELGIFDNARAVLHLDSETLPPRFRRRANTPPLPGFDVDESPDPDSIRWYTDNGCSWSSDDSDVPDLDNLEVAEFEENEQGEQRDSEGRHLDDVRGTGVLCIDDDGNGYCPVTGCRIVGGAF